MLRIAKVGLGQEIEMEKLRQFVVAGKPKETAERVQQLLGEGKDPDAMMKEAMIPAMDVVGDLFQKGEVYLPELMAAKAMKAGMEILRPGMVQSGVKAIGSVVVGTVRGDMHDIGKNLLAMSLEGAGFDVVDLGTDVPPEKFVQAVKEHGPQVIGLSALLTTTMIGMKDTIEAIEEAGLRGSIRVMIGGAPVTREFAEEIGADFYGPDSTSGKDFARKCVTG
jgi:5-methyltetrahydrofolate--homocysteine methyltransferase